MRKRAIKEKIEDLKIIVNSNEGLSPKLKGMIGIVKLPDDFDEKKQLTEHFENNHLRGGYC
jgi:hypothetical protein